MMDWLMEQFLLPFLATIATGAIAVAAAKFTSWTGVKIEANHREALHRALMTGVRMAISQFGPGANKAQIASAAVAYTERSVPDALAKLKPSPDHLNSMAEAKLVEAKAGEAR